MNTMRYYLKKISTWLLPHACILCGAVSNRSQDICQPCLNDLPALLYSCPRCAKPLPPSETRLLCGFCLSQPASIISTYALYLYQPPISKLIMNLKFGHALANARLFGELLAEKIIHNWYQNLSLPEVIIPVPLHPLRLRERGFNQAVEIARPLAKLLDLPLDSTSCQRIKHTAAQTTLQAEQRKHNVKDAFQVNNEISYRHVAVIDDVITTGHTITEFCNTLQQTGIQKIDIWCCARPQL